MNNNIYPLKGHFDNTLHVVVEGEEASEQLKLLGSYGADLDNATRKNIARRGQSDRQLSEFNIDRSEPAITILSTHEAFFLTYGLGCLAISSSRLASSNNLLDISTIWREFRKITTQSNNKLDFAIEYGVYHYFRTRGWIVKSGENYGTNFLLYKESPSIDHSRFAVVIIPEDKTTLEDLYSWKSLLTFHRVIQSVGKNLLLAYVKLQDQYPTTFKNPNCIQEFVISCKLFNAQANTLSKKQETRDSDL